MIVIFYRKLYVAFFTSILAVIFMCIVEPISQVDGEIMLAILVYSSFVVPIVYIYGVLTSMIAEQISFKVKNKRELVAISFHFLFGIIFIIPYYFLMDPMALFQLSVVEIVTDPMMLYGAIFSIVFYGIDCLIRGRRLEATIESN